ncbi:hypothetical protein [Pseudonocardia sp. TMWB2A]|uniref:hypothetical protein n=1 Tax=Pseudonocardia sp. TMWB2A TaxID=687430 RepID=UPI00307D7C9B
MANALSPFVRRFLRRLSAAAWVALALAVPSAAYAAPEPSPSPVGIWRGESVDSVSQLIVLDDHQYCFTLIAGSLDLISAGRWEAEGGLYKFTEKKAQSPLFPMAMRTGHAKPGTRKLALEGDMFSYANAPVIGFLKTRTDALSLRRLFPRDKHSWSGRFEVPAAAMAGARYVVIGEASDVQVDEASDKPYRLNIYELGQEDAEYRITYDRQQAMPPLDFTANVGRQELTADEVGRLRRSDIKLTATLADAIRRDCIEGAEMVDAAALQSRGITWPAPVETRIVAAPAINEDPVFETTSVVEATDILEPLESTQVPAPLARETLDQPSPSPGVDGLEKRFNAIIKIESAAKRVVGYEALWKAAINSEYTDQREVAARAAINMSNDLSAIGKYNEAIKVSGDAYAALISAPDPVLRSRAASLLNNQATAWEGLKKTDEQEAVWQRIITDFGADSYPTTVYVRATTVLNMVDRLIIKGRPAEAVAMLDTFERDYIESGRLATRPEEAFGINCDSDGKQFTFAVPCRGSKRPDLAYFKDYVAAYRKKIASLK